jgi:hypothetical protein
VQTDDHKEEGEATQSSRHWLSIAATSLLLGTLTYAGLLFPFAITDGLLGLDCHGWVKGSRGAASMLFILGWGCAIAIMAGRVFGRTESLEEIGDMLSRKPASQRANKASDSPEPGSTADS